MSLDQANELLKALNQHNWFLVVCGVVWVLGAILQFLVVTRIKSVVENKQHFSRIRYEREINIYTQVWAKCLSLRDTVKTLPVYDTSHPESQTAPMQKFIKAYDELCLAVRDNCPFYPQEIWNELKDFQKLCYELSLIIKNPNRGVELEDLLTKIDSQSGKIEGSIRSRLDKFDGSQ